MTDDDSTGREPAHCGSGPHPPIVVSDPGKLLAAIPHLLGFYPTDSIILVVRQADSLVVTVRLDLPADARSDRRVAAEAVASVAGCGAAGVVAFLVGDDLGANGVGVHSSLAAHLAVAFALSLDVIVDVYGVPEIAVGARWFEYGVADHTGVVPDPESSPSHVAAVTRGLVTRPSRAAVAATLEPDAADVLDRRAALIAAAAEQFPFDLDPLSTAAVEHVFRLVEGQIERAADRSGTLTDREVAELALALVDLRVRDWCIAFAIGEHAVAAERLWTELTRATPAPERAEPAALLAISAYLRGNGALAALALDRAEAALPHHKLASLLRTSLTQGLPPTTVRHLAERAQAARRDFLAEHQGDRE
ncbi:DUF4192 domain-containing protein [Actinosynnema sp. CS-041913]|uniref:DUF4192 domain-containing protein n=1 Tax=Actinosynnema sp. CS-041913 TaxID=3239917 RepID=UPI003D921CF6